MNRNAAFRLVFSAVLAAAAAALTSCAAPNPGAANNHPAAASPASQAARHEPPEVYLSLSEIRPLPVLPPPTTRPATRPSLAAIDYFAQARAASDRGNRVRAVYYLERAIKADPASVELYAELARVELANAAYNDASISALETALAIQPDNLKFQYQLGRQYLAKSDATSAMIHLRLAQQTTAYENQSDPPTAALADFYLAKALSAKGYARAALECYHSLLTRLKEPDEGLRFNPELSYLLIHPEILCRQMADLYEKGGDLQDALQMYLLAAKRDPESFLLRASVVRLLAELNQTDDAQTQMSRLLLDFHADASALAVVKQAMDSLHKGDGLPRLLDQLHHSHPDDRNIYFALADALEAGGQYSQARSLLEQWALRADPDTLALHKLFSLYLRVDDIDGALRLLVAALAQRPDSLRDLAPLCSDVVERDFAGRLCLASLQKLKLPPAQEASRLYWVARMAAVWNRGALVEQSLQTACAMTPPFGPAYRMLMQFYFARSDWDAAQKTAAAEKLIASVRAGGQLSLAAELEGLCRYNAGDAAAAIPPLLQAAQLSNHSVDLQILLADAYAKNHQPDQAIEVLQKAQHAAPSCEDIYVELLGLQMLNDRSNDAAATLHRWLTQLPQSIDARLLQVDLLSRGDDLESIHAGQAILEHLLKEHPADAGVLDGARKFYGRQGQTPQFLALLEEQCAHHPDNRMALEMLVDIYDAEHRPLDALRVLDAARMAAAHDTDRLYVLSHLYDRVDRKDLGEQVLQQVLVLDPHHAAAANDLGYSWADQGKNLDQARKLIAIAVAAEPDNQSYLDSMGWVEYKQGKFLEARSFLDRALAPANQGDPVVLNHLGDVLYRLSRQAEAGKTWQQSLDLLKDVDSARDDLVQLKAQLQQKIRQQASGRPVDVAPVDQGTGR